MATHLPIDATSGGVNIEAWTEDARQALGMMSITSQPPARPVRGASVTLDIPLDEAPQTPEKREVKTGDAPASTPRTGYARPHEPRRRDSLKRREALLKGKEGSRRRQKWENDRLIGNPWVEPPEPHDWEVRPTHPARKVPYMMASLWDERRAQAKMKAANEARKAAQLKSNPVAGVPRDLRQKLKRSKGAKGLLQDLEEQVREFVKMWEEKERQLQDEGLADAASSDEEEIVFVGRNGQMRDDHLVQRSQKELERDKLIFDSLVDDHGASFGRWLVHNIAAYYDLRTWSRTIGDPARREAFVGISESTFRMDHNVEERFLLPRPLWAMV
ncbi:MAG: hypothetical protein M1828_006226 [Chrysothrix sp. TS-e1954]|nr:MAG: hypothetical protein M1828_006226 [Chrysothrix sp. TS-e1954]